MSPRAAGLAIVACLAACRGAAPPREAPDAGREAEPVAPDPCRVVERVLGGADVVCDVGAPIDAPLARTLAARPDHEELLLLLRTADPAVLGSVARVAWARKVSVSTQHARDAVDLRLLAPLRELRELSVTNAPVRALADAWTFERLEVLCAHEEGEVDLTGVSKVAALRTLAVGAKVRSLAPLATSRSLEGLIVRGEQRDLGPVAALPRLTSLTVQVSPDAKLAPLSAMTALRELVIEGAQPSELARALGPLPALTRLFVRGGERVTDARPFAQLKGLELLDLNETRVTSIAPLRSLPRLKTLQLWEAPVKDLLELASFPALESVLLPRDRPDAVAAELRRRMPRVRL